jgi:hypothetical protein
MKKHQTLLLLALTISINLAGCQFATLLLPDPRGTTPAEYKLPAKQRYAIFIDDYMAPVGSPEAKKALAQKIGNYLVEGKAIKQADLVDAEKVYDQPTDSPDGKKLSIQHIGSQTGADYVIYINVVEFNLQSDEDNPLVQPKARAFVKLIEVSTGERIWPVDMAGFSIEAKEHPSTEMMEDADKTEWNEKLTEKLAAEVAEIFFDHGNS